LSNYVVDDLKEIKRLWPQNLPVQSLDDMISYVLATKGDWSPPIFMDLIDFLGNLLMILNDHILSSLQDGQQEDIVGFLHPAIVRSSYRQFTHGNYREAVLNALIGVFDLLRERTGLDLDGSLLAQTAYSLSSAKLIVSTLRTESGKNEQIGFIELLKGAYSSIRNPKAHSLLINPDRLVAAQNLIFASLLARRIEESKFPSQDQP
jgi:uncharacterized protein (TIGR02391 family)